MSPPSLSSISPNRLSGTRMHADIGRFDPLPPTRGGVAGEECPCFVQLTVEVTSLDVLSHLLFAFHPPCMSSSDLFFSEKLLPVPRKTDTFSVSFIYNFPLPDASCISILCIKVGQRSKCSKDFKLAGRKIEEGPITLSYRNLCSGGWALENQGFPLHCMFSRIRCLNNHGFWI